MKNQPAKPKTVTRHALRDVIGGDRDDNHNLVSLIPNERFGKPGKARYLRKLALIAIAKSADADGKNAYPSQETIAERCGASVRSVREAIKWLEENGLLSVELKAKRTSERGWTNRYTILFPAEGTPGTSRPSVASQTPGSYLPHDDPATPGSMPPHDEGQHPAENEGSPGRNEGITRQKQRGHLGSSFFL